MKSPLALFFKAHVGPYLRGGRMVNLDGYQGRAARAVASPGQMGLFGEGGNRHAEHPPAAEPEAHPHATETPEFKEWSGGLPLIKQGDENFGSRGVYVAYHATPHEFKEFKTGGVDSSISGNAIWASPYPDHQAASHNIHNRAGFKDGVRVMPIYVRLSRPLLIDDMDTLNWARQTFADGSMEFPQIMPKKWADEVMRDGEYDGIVFDGEKIFGRGKDNEIIAFDPRQIKSAIGNNGKFDRNNPDITKALPIVFLGTPEAP